MKKHPSTPAGGRNCRPIAPGRSLHRPAGGGIWRLSLLALALWTPGGAAPQRPAPPIEAVVVPTTDKLRPEAKPVGLPKAEVEATRGEREAFQVAILPGPQGLRGVTASVSPLRHAVSRSTLPAGQVEIRLVGYAQVKEPSWRGIAQAGRWPDPLLELRPFDVPPGECRCLWVTLSVPETAAPGDHHGALEIRSGEGGSARVPIRLHVWGFSLPRRTHLSTSYWMAKSWVTPFYPEDASLAGGDLAAWKPFYDAFGRYRLCTDLWVPPHFSRRADGFHAVDVSRFVEHLGYFVRAWRPAVVQVGCGCWGGSAFDNIPLYDADGKLPLEKDEKSGKMVPRKAGLSSWEAVRLFYDALRPHIEQWGMAGRVYLQLWDEPNRDAWGWGVRPAYSALFRAAPDIPGLCVVGIHPELQGAFDIFCPHTIFSDPEVYRQLRAGISLRGPKAVPAEATASSTGGWSNAAFYTYRPGDAYDGCDYTVWTSKEPPTPEKPQWLQLAFARPAQIDGIRLAPKKGLEPLDWTLSVSADGKSFTEVPLRRDAADPSISRFDAVETSFVRLTFRGANQRVAEAPAPRGVGLREVEFLGPRLSREETLPRERVRKMRVWEYNVGADYPSFCVDSAGLEQRSLAWLCWERGVEGFLYYGGAWFPEEWAKGNLPAEQPLDWPAHGTNGGQYLIYPGPGKPSRPLPSIRLALMGEGMEDYEYLWLLRESLVAARLEARAPTAALDSAAALLAQPIPPLRGSAPKMMAYRRRVAQALETLAVPARSH